MQTQCTTNEEADDDLDWEINVDRTANSIRRKAPTAHINPASDRELSDIIKNLSTRKAPGIDEVSNKALTHMPKKAMMALLNIVNAIVRLCHFPARWKTALVVFLAKTNIRSPFPQDYRPISLLPTMAKVTEVIILNRLKEKAEELVAIPEEQFEFRAGHSTELYVTEGMTRRHSTSMICLDISKAFDTVWHNGIIYKVSHMNFPINMVKLIQSFLSNRTCIVRLESEYSDPVQQEAGVPQGSVLAPLLYTLYTNDPPRTRFTMLALYADNIAIASRSKFRDATVQYVQNKLDELEEWLKTWKVKANPQKTQAIFLTKRRHFPATITQGGHDIPWTNTVKYLGGTLDRSLTWKAHIQNAISKANNKYLQLLPLLGRRSKLHYKTKARLYKSIKPRH